MVAKKPLLALSLLLLAIPITARAAAANYTSSTTAIEIPDSFSINDLDVTLNLDADIHALDVNLTSPAGTRIGLYTRNRAFGTKFRNTIIDDEGSVSLSGSSSSWTGRFRPDQPLNGLDGSNAEGTWTLELSYADGSAPALPIVLQNWTLTFQGANPAAIAGIKYHDQNGNGGHDDGEPGLENWTIYADTNDNGQLNIGEQSTTTNSEGNYQLDSLDIKDYIVREVMQPNWFIVSPGTNRQAIRTRSGETAPNINFGNIPSAETEAKQYGNETITPIQDDGEAVRARSTIHVSDSFSPVDVNVTLNMRDVPFLDTEVSLSSPNGTRVILFKPVGISSDRWLGVTFDDQAEHRITNGHEPWTGHWLPRQPLGTFNTKETQGDWTLEVKDTNPANGTSGQLDSWSLELSQISATDPEPIVLVPGMTASLNVSTIFADGNEGPWRFTPGARAFYQALTDRLKSVGFTENQNLFISHYDWRNPIHDAATNYLKPMIDHAKETTGADKVDIVTHSMGGLVARSYIQGESYEDDVDQLITLGTPHLGASDAYIAWEGGDFPDRWGPGIRLYLLGVENSLRIHRAAPLPRPLSFRAFFPSLKDLLPTQNFVQRNNTPLAVDDMVEQNPFLQLLADTSNRLDATIFTTIAGSGVETLNQVKVDGSRSPLDIALSRWRDGHPNPDPPAADTTLGDQTVLLSSALFGTNTITKVNTAHDKLPEEAQEEVLEALGLDSSGPHIAYDTPDSLVGTVVLSPVIPKITLPNGTTFICDTTKQEGNAECIVDETDPNGPKLLVIADPPIGDYKITLTGTGSGEYHAITCFADEDQDVCTVKEGTTSSDMVETYTVGITPDSFQPPVGDVVSLLRQLKDHLFHLLLDKHIKPRGIKLHGLSTRLLSFGKNWEKDAKKSGENSKDAKKWNKKVKSDFTAFSKELDNQIKRGMLDPTAIREIIPLRDQLKDAGL